MEPALVTGRVVGSGGQPVEGARVMFVNAPGAVPDVAALTDASGRFSLTAPSAGAYTLEVAADGYRNQRETVTVSAGDKRELNIVLQPVR
jgi:hypothetical protein